MIDTTSQNKNQKKQQHLFTHMKEINKKNQKNIEPKVLNY